MHGIYIFGEDNLSTGGQTSLIPRMLISRKALTNAPEKIVCGYNVCVCMRVFLSFFLSFFLSPPLPYALTLSYRFLLVFVEVLSSVSSFVRVVHKQ